MKTFLKKMYDWVDERVELKGLVDYMGKKYVPVHRHSVWYYFGGVSLFLFIIQVSQASSCCSIIRAVRNSRSKAFILLCRKCNSAG